MKTNEIKVNYKLMQYGQNVSTRIKTGDSVSSAGERVIQPVEATNFHYPYFDFAFHSCQVIKLNETYIEILSRV